MSTLGDLIVKVGADISGFTTAMKSVAGQLDDLGDKVEEKFSAIESVGKRLAIAGAELTAAVTLPLVGIGTAALETAAQFEQTEIAFTTFMGSAEAAKGMLADLYQFAATTPFQVSGILQGTRTLLAMQFAAKDVIPVMRTLGDAASGLGLGQEGLERLVFHLGQIKAEGSIDGRVLRELGQMGINAGQMLADALGKSVPDIRKMITEKAIDATTAINALLQGMNANFGGMMQNQMASLSGMWSNFKDNVTLAAVQIGDTLLPVGKQVLDWALATTNAIKELAQWFMGLPSPVKAGALALAAMAAAAGPVLAALGGIGLILPGIIAVVEPLAAVLGVSVVALGGWAIAIAAALAALVALGVWVAGHWDGVKAAASTAWDGIAELWKSTIGVPVNWVIDLFEWAAGKSRPIWEGIASVLSSVWDGIKSAALSFWNFLKNDILEPMFSWLEKIPGVMKLLSVGDAFKNADAAAQKAKETAKSVSDAMGTLRLGANTGAPQLSDPKATWLDAHKKKVEEYTKALDVLQDAYKTGAVSADTLQKAQERLNQAIHEKMPDYSTETKKGKGGEKVDRNALDEMSGEHAHEQAGFQRQRSEIEHDYQMSQPGTADKIGEDSEDATAQQELAAAEKRRQALDAVAKEELAAAITTANEKLTLYKSDEAGYQKLIAAKTAAQDKYDAQVLKNKQDEENVEKRVNDRLLADDLRVFNEDLKRMAEAEKEKERLAKEHQAAMVAIADTVAQAAKRHEESLLALRDNRLKIELDMGELSKAQYLRLKQEEYDEAYRMEVEAIQKERALLDQEFSGRTDQAALDEYAKKQAGLDSRQQEVTDKHTERSQGTQDDLKLDQTDNEKKFFDPIQQNFATGITSMIEGTKSFKDAWSSMVTGMLSSWISSLAQMAARWVTHKLMELTVHIGTNQAKVASDASASAQSNAISLAQHFREIARHAAQAAAATWKALAGIPIIGPILAPIGAAAAFVGVMALGAVSAERGAVLPDENTMAFLHPKEMVLPSKISTGLQSLINNGGLSPDTNSIAFAQSGAASSSTMQGLAAANDAKSSGDNHFHGGIQLAYHGAKGESLTPDRIYSMMQQATRMKNLKMA